MKSSKNILNLTPRHSKKVGWSQDLHQLVTLEVKNRGVANFIAQTLFKKPRVSYIHLEEFGSFIWLQIDGQRDVRALGEQIKKRFGDSAQPIYSRLIQYIKTLKNNNFITV